MADIHEVIGHMSSMRVNKYHITATGAAEGMPESDIKDIKCSGIQRRDNVVLEFQEEDIDKILLSKGILADKNNIDIAEALLKADAEITPENIAKVAELKNMVEYITSEISEYVAALLLENETLPSGISQLCEVISRIKNEYPHDDNVLLLRREADDKAIEKEIIEIYGTNHIEASKKEIAKELYTAGIPVTSRNIERVETVLDDLSKLKIVNDEAIAVCIKNEAAFSIDSLQRAALYALGRYSSIQSVSREDLKHVDHDIKKLLVSLGYDTSERSASIARAIIKIGAGLSKETIDTAIKVKDDISFIKDNSNKETAVLLARKNIDAEKADVSAIAQVIKQQIKTKEQACSIYQNQSGSYISTKIINESSEKLEKAVAEFLKTEGMTADTENVLICKALIKNGINISKKAIEDFKLLLGIENIQQITKYFNERFIINDKVAYINELVKALQTLDNKANERLRIYGRDSIQYINVKNIRDKMSEVLDANFKAIGMMLKCNLLPTERNARIVCGFSKNSSGKNGLNVDFRLEPAFFEYLFDDEACAFDSSGLLRGLKQEFRQYGSLLNYTQALRGMKTYQAALTAKFNDMHSIKNIGIRDLAVFVSGTSNKLSLSRVVDNLEFIIRHDKHPDEKINKEIAEILDNIKDELPRADLKNFKQEGIIEFCSFMREKVKYMKQKLEVLQAVITNTGGYLSGAVSKVINDLNDISFLYSHAQKDFVFAQVPFIYNGRVSNLNLIINKKRNRFNMKEGEEPYCVSMNLETNTLGVLDIGLEIKGRSVKASIRVEKDSYKEYFMKMSSQLQKKISDAGFNLQNFSCITIREAQYAGAAGKRQKKQQDEGSKSIKAGSFKQNCKLSGGFEVRI